MCGEHTRNTWRTVCDYVVNIPQNANEQSVKCPHTPTKYATNTPLGVGDRFIVPVSWHKQKRVFP